MSTQLQQFSFEQNGMLADVRVHVDEKGDPWFVAKDVCSVLGYKNTSLTISKHCEEKGISKRYTLSSGGEQELEITREYQQLQLSDQPEIGSLRDAAFKRSAISLQRHDDTALTHWQSVIAWLAGDLPR